MALKFVLTIFGTLAILSIAAVSFLFFMKPHESSSLSYCAQADNPPKIIAFGDSLVAGYGVPQGSDFSSVLSQMIGVPIINNGVDGDTTSSGLARVQDIIDQHPDIVILLLGGNDALRRIPQSTTRDNLSQIILKLQANNIRVVLIGVLGGYPRDPFAAMFAELSTQYDVAYVPNILDGLILHKAYMVDEVHPNETGHQKIATKIQPVLNASCKAFAAQ